MDDAGRRDQFICRVALDVEMSARLGDLDGQRPDLNGSERPHEGRMVEAYLDSTELGELCDLPKDDSRDAPAVASKESAFSRGEVARKSVDQNVGIKIEHASGSPLKGCFL